MSIRKIEQKINEEGIGTKSENGRTITDTKNPIMLLDAISRSQKNLIVWQPIYWSGPYLEL